MSDLISGQDAIDARRYTFGNDEFSLEAAYHDCKMVFDGITDDDSFQKADTGLILYYANEIVYALHEALEGKDTNVLSNDCISRQAAIDAFWKLDIETRPSWIDAVMTMLKQLPSAEQKKRTEERTKMHSCDLISRQDAIDALGKRPMVWTDNDSYSLGQRNQYDFDKLAIETVPSAEPEHKIRFADKDHVWIDGKQYISLRRFQEAVIEAQPERKTGRWELHTYIPHKKYCTNCKKESPYNLRWDFCPSCGCKMEVEHETD